MSRVVFFVLFLAAVAYLIFREMSNVPDSPSAPAPTVQCVQPLGVSAQDVIIPFTPTPEYTVTALALQSTAAANAQAFAEATKQTIDNEVAAKRAAVELANLRLTESIIATAQAQVNATPTPTPTPTITPTPNATMTAHAITAVAKIWTNRVNESEANQESAERGAQIWSMLAGLAFFFVLAVVIVPVLFGWRWVERWRDELKERDHRRTLADREHAARFSTAQVEQVKTESAKSAAEERQAVLDYENFERWRRALKGFLQWWQALPEPSKSRDRMEDAYIVSRGSWNKCVAALEALGAIEIDQKGTGTARKLLTTPDSLARSLTPTTLGVALETAKGGLKLAYPPAVTEYSAASARTKGILAELTPPPLSEMPNESVSAV